MARRILVSVSTLIVISFILIYVYVVFKKRYAALKPLKPDQIHLSYGEKSNDIVLTWSTQIDPTWTYVIYGFCKGSLSRKANGTRTTFVDKGPLQSTRTIHRAILKDLEFNAAFKYRVGSPKAWSGTLTFKTPPAGENWAVKALVFGGLGENSLTLPFMIKDVENIDFNLIIHAGDIGYDLSKHDGVAGDSFINAIQPLAAKVPYMVCPGNLERFSNYSHYKERFTMPSRDKYQNMFYSFNLGPVHFVSINTGAYYDCSKSPNNDTNAVINQILTQYNWLKRDLAEANGTANREVRPWIILYGHHPMLCSNCLDFDRSMKKEYEFSHRAGNSSCGGYGLEELLKDYGVDLSIWHQHSYERLWPVYNKTVYNGSREAPYTNPRAPVHVTTGAAGKEDLPDDFVGVPPVWSAFRSRNYGYSRFSVRNRTHLFFEQLALKNDYMKQIDSFWLVREKHMPYNMI